MFLFYYVGGERFYDDMENMLGFRINPWVRWCWKFLTPLFCLVSPIIQLRNSFFGNPRHCKGTVKFADGRKILRCNCWVLGLELGLG